MQATGMGISSLQAGTDLVCGSVSTCGELFKKL